MSTTITKRARKQAQRSLQFIQTGLVNLLWIKQGSKTDGYMVENTQEETHCEEPTFRLTKTDGTIYNVLLCGEHSLCDCKGFEHRGMNTKDGKGCRHVAALTTLRQRSLI
ncbi:MAG TPA: hypothetical protein VMG10_30930 [Gemmataceae bacterium]|nr:hypothetical protein [Gemmataceae bacterium]